jgi:hypothetical protein
VPIRGRDRVDVPEISIVYEPVSGTTNHHAPSFAHGQLLPM